MLCYPEIHRLRAPIYPQVFVCISCRRSGYLLGGVGGEGELWCRLPRGFGLSGYCGLCSPDSPPLLLCPFPPDWLLQSRRLDQASFRFSTFPPPAPPLCPQSHIRTPPFKASVSFIHSRHNRSSGKLFSNCHHITPQYKISSRLQSQINHAPSSGVPPGAEEFRGLLIPLSRGLSPLSSGDPFTFCFLRTLLSPLKPSGSPAGSLFGASCGGLSGRLGNLAYADHAPRSIDAPQAADSLTPH